TVFPLAWIVSSIIIFGSYLLIGGLITNLAGEFTDVPVVDWGPGVAVGILFSLVMGFLSTVAATLIAVAAAVIYNFLAALGGGVSVGLSEPFPAPEPTQGEPGSDKVEGPGVEP
ncbi:unnamed protein product, partial [marine sediment metagenome]